MCGRILASNNNNNNSNLNNIIIITVIVIIFVNFLIEGPVQEVSEKLCHHKGTDGTFLLVSACRNIGQFPFPSGNV